MQPLGPVQANCYVLVQDGQAIVIDPGDKFPSLSKVLEQENATLKAVLLTHGHFDHIHGLKDIVEQYGCEVYMSPYEFDFLTDATLNGSVSFGRFTQIKGIQPLPVKEGKNTIAGMDFEAIYCPGHSIGSIVYIIEDSMFSGDVLFQGSIGRTDLETGSDYAMEKSLQKLKKLEKNYYVYPGHGPGSTLDQEKSWNPYLYRL